MSNSDIRAMNSCVCGNEGMRTPRLAKAPQQCLFRGLQEDHRGAQRTLERAQDCRQLLQALAFADVHHQRGTLYLERVARQIGKSRNELHWKVVNAVVA